MRGYARVASVGLLMMGLVAVPNLSLAGDRDGNGRHSLLNSELRSKIEHLRDKMANHRDHHHNVNQGDVAGGLAALQTEVANLKAALTEMAKNDAALVLQLNDAKARLSLLETSPPSGGSTNPALTELAKYVKVDPNPINGLKGPHVIFHHANVHVESGSGTTDESSVPTGLGNLIVGYNEMPTAQEMPGLPGWSRVGSHNLVVGRAHSFSSTAGAVFGNRNLISGQYATILGGVQNSSRGPASSILGGFNVVVDDTEATYP